MISSQTHKEIIMSKIKTGQMSAELLTILKSYEAGEYARLTEGKALIFWSNDFDAETRVHHGKNNALNYSASSERLSGSSAVLLSDIEAASAGKVPSQDAAERNPDLSSEQKRLIAALGSAAFAMSAKGTAICSTKGSAPQSYFRQVELDIIMNNPSITNILTIDRDHPDGKKLLPKMEAYHVMRDEWAEHAINNLTQAHEKLSQAPDNPALKAVRDSALNVLAEEMIMAERMASPDLDTPFMTNKLLPPDADRVKYNAHDKARETDRISKLQSAIESVGLKEEVELLLNTKRQQSTPVNYVDRAIDTVKSDLAHKAMIQKRVNSWRRHMTSNIAAKATAARVSSAITKTQGMSL